jgi:hypothetical protein
MLNLIMFNKQFSNKMVQNQNPMYAGVRQSSQYVPMYPEMSYYSQADGMYDNRTLYSASTISSNSQIVNPNLKKKILDDINSLLSGCIENIIPKLVDECADSIFAKISIELDKQSKEIEEIRSQISNFDEMIGDKCNSNKTYTPLKNIKKSETNMSHINKIVRDQKLMVEEFQRKEEMLLNLRLEIEHIRDKLLTENELNERVNSQIREKNVDLLDMKRFIDQKINNISNNMRNMKQSECSTRSTPGAQFDQIIGLIDKITEKTERHSFEINNFKNINYKTVYSDVEIKNDVPQIFRREDRKPLVKKGRKSNLSNVDFTF